MYLYLEVDIVAE